MTTREIIKILRLSEIEVQKYPETIKTISQAFELVPEVHEPTVHLVWLSLPYTKLKEMEERLNRVT